MDYNLNIFNECTEINNLVNNNLEKEARNKLIILLDKMQENNIHYFPLLNHLIREVGLFPYMDNTSSEWEDLFVKNCFRTNIGNKEDVILHREQSLLLKKLLEGKNIAVSAPTSFGKSFIIDAFIKIKEPNNVMIIVPTIALADETRRRIYKKFSNKYKIITTTDVTLETKNIFIFPQERALTYWNKLKTLDLLVIDEFYKSSKELEKERSSSLIEAIIKLGNISKQKYFLAPNISTINDNPFTKDMEILKLDFNTVFIKQHKIYTKIQNLPQKETELKFLLNNISEKSLIYAGTYKEVQKVAEISNKTLKDKNIPLLESFSKWLSINYSDKWILTELIKKGIGIHTGKIHRSLSQLQIRLFEDPEGLNKIISTSSIIEGVNTSAENVIIWKSKKGQAKLDNFSYKNIVGRAGRMFKYFIGNIYLLDEPPKDDEIQLNIEFPEERIGNLNAESDSNYLTNEQIIKVQDYDSEMISILGKQNYLNLKNSDEFSNINSDIIKTLAITISDNIDEWTNLKWLNSKNCNEWDYFLFKILYIYHISWGTNYTNVVQFIKIISQNWTETIPTLLKRLEKIGLNIDDFFKLERDITFKLSSILQIINSLQLILINDKTNDITPFIRNISFAFLPPVVYQLEEFGLPRMISKKIQKQGLINFEQDELKVDGAINQLKQIGLSTIIENIDCDDFDKYILTYFFDGITTEN